MQVVHLTASTFYGGPERQMLGLAEALRPDAATTFVSFREHGDCREFLETVRDSGFPGLELRHDTPKIFAAANELTTLLRVIAADVLLCHGYKSNLVGRMAARRVGIPVVAVSRGWTGENRKMRLYESLDRFHLRFLDHVVAVSNGQAEKVRRCGVPECQLSVIRNAARLDAFTSANVMDVVRLREMFPSDTRVSQIVLAAGRLSPEKGFDVLIEAAALLRNRIPDVGFVLFGEGAERPTLERKIAEFSLAGRFLMPGFTRELDRLVPCADVLAVPSFTEGLPNVALEASAAGVPSVATNVGGNPEVIEHGVTGFIVPPGEPTALAERMFALLSNDSLRSQFGFAAQQRMHDEFTFAGQASSYLQLFEKLGVAARVGVAA